MKETWDRRIERARQLAAQGHTASASLLDFYAGLLAVQRELYEFLRTRRGWLPSGSLERDFPQFRPQVSALLAMAKAKGPAPLAAEARQWLDGPESALDDLLLAWWRSPSDRQFFAKAALQPYARWLADAGIAPFDRDPGRATNRCPFCGGAPQLSILDRPGESEGGGRSLMCSTCLTVWTFRRVLCAWCGEEDERKLGYFHSPEFDHLRVDACDACGRYQKSVDLTRLGLAVPIVDEVAGAPLDLWAREHGYEKIELNLVGL